jgi:superoxide dismutase, Cu-Zn family
MSKTRTAVLGVSVLSFALGALAWGCDDTSKPPASSSGGTSSGGSSSGGSSSGGSSSGGSSGSAADTGTDAPAKFTAKANITATSDASVVTGTATFTEENGEVTAVITITNGVLPGNPGLRGLHIHANNSCALNDAGPDGSILFGGAAGGHWNPLDASHGYPDGASHHAGDMGNILIADGGTGTLTIVSKDWTVQPGAKSVVGHAIVFHLQTDDGVSQPVGNAGARPGCGLIILQ